VDEKAFQCPEISDGGHPRTNPGNSDGWVGGQVDDSGSGPPGQIKDKQAIWMSYTGNAALMSRNKFVCGSKGDRYNVFVKESAVRQAAGTILATEFGKNFLNVSVAHGSGRLSKSHRPVHPFYDRFVGAYNVYAGGGGKARAGAPAPFTYGNPTVNAGGILEVGTYENRQDLIEDANDVNKLNCVGRHHPGGGVKHFGGTANFLYLDSHVERKSVLDTLIKKEWGDRFYSLHGNNGVDMTVNVTVH